MEEGTVIRWLKKIGEPVAVGEPLLEIETDKVSMEVEAEHAGYLIATLRHEGEVVPVVETIGYIGEQGEQPPTASAATEAAPNNHLPTKPSDVPSSPIESSALNHSTSIPSRTIAATPAARRIATQQGIDIAQIMGSGAQGEIRAIDVQRLSTHTHSDAPPKATPLARKIAHQQGLDLRSIQGSGTAGRIERRDIERQLSNHTQHPTTEKHTEQQRIPKELPTTPQPLVGMRKTIAQRMSATHHAVPPVTLVRPAQFDQLMQLRQELNHAHAHHFSVNDLLSYATVRALQDYPELNATYHDNEVTYIQNINLGIAVAVEDGLLVPVIKRAEQETLASFAERATTLATQARAGQLGPDELQGGSFTITNLGMYGITDFTPIINAPQIAILGICAPETVLKLHNGQPTESTLIRCALTIDHRILDGALAAQFLQRLANLVEHPIQLLL